MKQEERQELSAVLTTAARDMAQKRGQHFPHRVRISNCIMHDVECHTSNPRVVYVGAHAVTAARVMKLLDRILLDARELRLQLHQQAHDPIAQTEKLVELSLKESNGKELQGCPKLTCILCGDEATARVMGLSHRFETCTPCAREIHAALGRKVRVITLHRF